MDHEKLMLYAFKRFMEVTDDQFLLLDKDGRVAAINENYYRSLLLSSVLPHDKIIGRPIEEIFITSVLPELMRRGEPAQLNQDMFITGPEYSLDCGRKEIAVRTCANVLDDEGNMLGAFAIVTAHPELLRLCESVFDTRQKYQLDKETAGSHAVDLDGQDNIIGSSQEILQAKDKMLRAAQTSSNVMITGESGTGKELFARAIHHYSARSDGPFVALNCSAIPSELFESELFGYEEGAFTGARKGGKMGEFERADGGTLFLDEIADMPFFMQAKLLRVLQEGEIKRLGGGAVKKLNVRIIAATNKDLYKCVRKQTFRSDLYYRLNVLTISVPPLRSRREDIITIATHFLQDLNEKYGTRVFFSSSAMNEMEVYDWPGNVRELKNMVERMYVFHQDSMIRAMVFDEPDSPPPEPVESGSPKISLQDQMDSFERSILTDRLRACQYNIRKTAESLDLNRTTLYHKIKKHGIFIPTAKSGSDPAP